MFPVSSLNEAILSYAFAKGGIRVLANGDKTEELLKEYPSLKVEDIYACLDYAASLAEEQITPIEIEMFENAL